MASGAGGGAPVPPVRPVVLSAVSRVWERPRGRPLAQHPPSTPTSTVAALASLLRSGFPCEESGEDTCKGQRLRGGQDRGAPTWLRVGDLQGEPGEALIIAGALDQSTSKHIKAGLGLLG